MRKAYIIGVLLITALLVLGACTPTSAPPEELLVAPKLLSPHNETTGIELSPILLWEPVPEAEGYELKVSRNSDFSDIVIGGSLPGTSYEIAQYLAPLTRYYWMVGAKMSPENSDDPVAYSEVWTFTTAETSAPEPTPVKPPPLPEPPSSEPIKITAAQLSTEYDETGSPAAARKYKERLLEVSGTVDYLDTALGALFVSFEIDRDDPYAWEIHAFLADDQVSQAETLAKGDKITVVGWCRGVSAIPIILGDCQIIVP
ncbi:hypothetical protein ES703_84183 [subsurface metagenome]